MTPEDYEARINDWLSSGESKLSPADVEHLAAHLAAPAHPYLDHVYNGPALRLTGHEWVAIRSETIAGAFHVLYRDERCAVIDNGEPGSNVVWGEGGTGRWIVTMLDRLVKP